MPYFEPGYWRSTTLKHINFLLLVIILARVSMRDLKLTRLKAKGFLKENYV